MTQRVILCNFAWLYDQSTFLPLPSAMLAAYALADEEFRKHYDIDLEFKILRDDPDKIAEEIGDAAVIGLSGFIWNERLSLAVAERLKAKDPNCLIVFGGQSISQWPEVNERFLRANPCIDVAVRGEGEITFKELLLAHAREAWSWRREAPQGLVGLGKPEACAVAGTSYILPGGRFVMAPERKRERDLDVFPSPFLSGTFEPIMARYPQIEWQGLWETNRGCVFLCTFCSWSALALGAKLGVFPAERLKAEFEWFGQKKIGHVYCADANWAILPRDAALTDMITVTKRNYGFPKSFFVNTMKNATAKTFETAKKLFDAGMSKSLILSAQSLDEQTLTNIKRDNIKLSHYHNLQKMARAAGMPTCAELILGLPGETLDSYCRGLEIEMEARQFTLFQYHCVMLPGSEMAQPEYIRKFGIKTTRVTVASNHADLDEAVKGVPEVEDVVVETSSMPYADWLECNRVAWFISVFVCMGLTQYPLYWLKHQHKVKITDFARWALNTIQDCDAFPLLCRERRRLEDYITSIKDGTPTVPRYAIEDSLPIRWPLDEATFIAVSRELYWFYSEFTKLIKWYAGDYKLELDEPLLRDIVRYQQCRIVRWTGPLTRTARFSYNVHQYFERLLTKMDDAAEIQEEPTTIRVEGKSYSSPQEFSKKGVWFARRGGKFLYEAEHPGGDADA